VREYGHEFAEIWHHLPSSLEKAGGLRIIRIGLNHAKPNYRVGPRFSPYFSLHFVLEGQINYGVGSQTYLADGGDVFCVFPKTLYSYGVNRPDIPSRMFWMTFNGEQSLPLLQLIGIAPEICLVKKAIDATVSQVIGQITTFASADRHCNENLSLLVHTYRLFEMLSNAVAKIDENKDAVPWIRRSLEYMKTHFRDGISVENVANFMNLNRSHFTRAFFKQMGETPNRYLQTLRLQEADLLLRRTAMSVSEIALSVGYNDSYSFTRAYKKRYGDPPSKVREHSPSALGI
jgi:AraC-like DNA-binding protein